MRTYGRVPDPNNSGSYIPDPVTGKIWRVVQTDPAGFNDEVMLTTLAQVFELNLGESPFYAQYGIPAKPSVVQQVFPDFYVARTQRQFAPFFASLLIAKEPSPTPTYKVNVTTNQGFKLTETIPT